MPMIKRALQFLILTVAHIEASYFVVVRPKTRGGFPEPMACEFLLCGLSGGLLDP